MIIVVDVVAALIHIFFIEWIRSEFASRNLVKKRTIIHRSIF